MEIKPIRPGAPEEEKPTTSQPLPGTANVATPPGLTPTKPRGNAATAVKPKTPPKPAVETAEPAETNDAAPTKVSPAQPKALPPLPFEIEEIGQEEEQVWLRIIIYGPSGVGKTYLIGTAQDDPDTNSVFLIDAESGKATIKFKKGIRRSPVNNFSKVEGIISFLDKYFPFRDNLLKAQKALDEEQVKKWTTNLAILFRIPEEDREGWVPPIFQTVAVDSLTELQVYDMREIMEEVVKDDPTRDPDVPSPREWGKSQSHIKELIRSIRAMPCHAIFAALPSEREDKKTGEVTVWPDLPGKLATQVPALVDIVGYYYSYIDESQETQRILLTQNTGKYVAKDRTQSLGKFVVNPTIPKLFQMIREHDAQMKAE